jgi:hypothetical protein
MLPETIAMLYGCTIIEWDDDRIAVISRSGEYIVADSPELLLQALAPAQPQWRVAA